MREYVVKDRQSLMDVALQMYGEPSYVYDLAMINRLSPTDCIETGYVLHIPDIKTDIKEHLLNQLSPATALLSDSDLGGIEYMEVELDFIIQ